MTRQGFHIYHKSLVVLANPKAVLNDRYAKKEIKEKVIRVDQLIATMNKMLSEISILSTSSMKETRKVAESLLQKNKEERPDYISKYEELIKEMETDQKIAEDVPEQPQKLICPRCGAELILRTAKRGQSAGKQFYGCSAFPKCRFVMNIES